MVFVIRSYEGNDEWVSKKWLAHMNLGNDVYMSFFGATKVEAEDKARLWYEREKSRIERQYVPDGQVKVAVKSDWNAGWGNALNAGNDWGNTEHKMAGKVWMLNRSTGDRARIEQNEVAKYEQNGYIKAGPRSK